MTTSELFILSEQALDQVVAQIRDDQWGMHVPDWFQLGSTQDRASVTLHDLINYHCYDSAWVPDTLAAKTIEEVGDKYDSDLLGDDPLGNFQKYADTAIPAVQQLDDPDKIVHLTYGDFPAHEYLRHTASWRGFRAFDYAKLLGLDTKLPDELVQGMWDLLSPDMEEWRKIGVYGPAVPVADDAPLQDRLLGLSGRDPH